MFRKEKITAFFRKQGFYIALAACIAIVGVVSFLAVRESEQAEAPAPEEMDVRSSLDESIENAATPAPAFTTAPETVSPSPTPSEEHSKAPVNKQAAVKLIMPVEGEITAAFSGDVLTYNKTLKTWMTHNGIDIAAKAGTDVCAALSGEVSQVYMDESRGLTVEVSHSGDKKTVYVGLAEADVKAGDKVNAGTKLGMLGTPAFESHGGAHLHFEYTVKGEYKDPKSEM